MFANQVDRKNIDLQQDLFLDLFIGLGQQFAQKFMEMSVYIHGITGLGAEIAKNIVLSYPKQVSLFDPNLVSIEDLGRNFFVREEQIGKMTRAQAIKKQLCLLNTKTRINVQMDQDIQHIVDNYHCVVILDNYDREYLIKLNEACRQKNVGFIYGGNLGLYGFAFVDFGNKHIVLDQNGEQIQSVHIRNIENSEKGQVYVLDYDKHNFSVGDRIVFSQVQGMEEINGKQFQILDVRRKQQFSIGDTRKFGKYLRRGIATSVKVPIYMKFNSFQQSLNKITTSSELIIDQKILEQQNLHLVLNSVFDFWEKNKRIPRRLNIQDAEQLFKMVEKRITKIQNGRQLYKNLDKQDVYKISLYGECQIAPVCSIWAGILSTQVLKLTGKYKPLQNWLHYQFFDLLPSSTVSRNQQNSRYSDIATMFGDQFLQKLFGVSCMVLGTGSKGCELLKMFSMLGMARLKNSQIFCVDDRKIKANSMTKSCLFQSNEVNEYKSKIACKKIAEVNLSCNLIPITEQFSEKNYKHFPEQSFWDKVDFVVCAADTQKSKSYCDNQCVWYQKPMFEYGTFGTKCHSQVIIPFETNSFNDISSSGGNQLPFGLSPNKFPYKLQNLAVKSISLIECSILDKLDILKQFYQDKKKCLNELKKPYTDITTKLKELKQFLRINESRSFEQCVKWAKKLFNTQFDINIKRLLHSFPKDKLSETGLPFWDSKPCNCPIPIQLNINDPLHIKFIETVTEILANAFKIKKSVSILKILSEDALPESNLIDFENSITKQQNQAQKSERERKEMSQLENTQINELLTPTIALLSTKNISPLHLDFIYCACNLMARNYSIKQQKRLRIRKVTCGIYPKLISTVSMASGFICIEILKSLMKKPKDKHRNICCNLGIPFFIFSEPSPPKIYKDSQYDPIFCGPIKYIPQCIKRNYLVSNKWRKFSLFSESEMKQCLKFMSNYLSFSCKETEKEHVDIKFEITNSKCEVIRIHKQLEIQRKRQKQGSFPIHTESNYFFSSLINNYRYIFTSISIQQMEKVRMETMYNTSIKFLETLQNTNQNEFHKFIKQNAGYMFQAFLYNLYNIGLSKKYNTYTVIALDNENLPISKIFHKTIMPSDMYSLYDEESYKTLFQKNDQYIKCAPENQAFDYILTQCQTNKKRLILVDIIISSQIEEIIPQLCKFKRVLFEENISKKNKTNFRREIFRMLQSDSECQLELICFVVSPVQSEGPKYIPLKDLEKHEKKISQTLEQKSQENRYLLIKKIEKERQNIIKGRQNFNSFQDELKQKGLEKRFNILFLKRRKFNIGCDVIQPEWYLRQIILFPQYLAKKFKSALVSCK